MTMAEDAIHISMSTISPETSKEMADLHEESGSHYLASPVFGRPDAAAAKKLWVCISGKPAIKDLAKPILENIGQGVIDFGEDVRAANVVKLTGNFMILASLELMSEAYTLAEKYNVDRNAVSEFLSSTLFSAPIFKNYGKLIAEKQYEPVGFKAKLGYKDARLAFQLSQLSETPMPLVSLIHNRMLSAVAKGWGDRDWVEAISRGVTDDAGL
jgi:3-hydroxyisobutyrate dehydrogenase-like beta-hydroxyacid dehydrogenase